MSAREDAYEGAHPLAITGAAAVVLLAVGALVLAWAEHFVSCLDEDVCTGRGLARAQLALAIVNAGVALGFLVAVVRRARRPAIVLAVVFPVSFVAWALLIDASTHGWDDLRLLPG